MDHDLRQHLVVDLKTPLNARQKRLKLLVCDDRDADQCEPFLRHLPSGVVVPAWLAATRVRRHTALSQ